ncbi:MAG: hypothetical protein BAJATHORv1_20002 [Candidatus Thorarchaeota archaeon]|nr:MAG: hypothetical protein BAJATHORv1_20002 [Candidatus Thorarchaeota archaeon]
MKKLVRLIPFMIFCFLITFNTIGYPQSTILVHPMEKSFPAQWDGGLIIDHTCLNFDSISLDAIENAQSDVKIHYAHTSHGSQITTGLGLIEGTNSSYSVSIGYASLPATEDTLCIFDGQANNGGDTYITPDEYWEEESGVALTQGTLDDNPSLTVSLWSWCTQLNSYSTAQVQSYLDTMTSLEEANPDVTFVYMTCNAQADGSSGYNRWLNNEMIREYCIENDKVLFDFADLDSWHNGEQNTYRYHEGSTNYDVPLEHEDFNGNEAGHTTYSSCEQKAKAFWWMVCELAGWDSPSESNTNPNNGSNPPIDSLFSSGLIVAGVAAVVLIAAVAIYYRSS